MIQIRYSKGYVYFDKLGYAPVADLKAEEIEPGIVRISVLNIKLLTRPITEFVDENGNAVSTIIQLQTILENYQEANLRNIVYNENLIGLKNGVNSTFTTTFQLIPDTEEVFSNGIKLNKPDDYNISGQVITLTFSPVSGEQLTINYTKS